MIIEFFKRWAFFAAVIAVLGFSLFTIGLFLVGLATAMNSSAFVTIITILISSLIVTAFSFLKN